MSVDLSNEEVQRLQRAVLDKADPTTWFLLQYDPSNSSSLIPLASGSEPPLPQIKENLGSCGEELVYGYADVQGKGLIVVYMAESVGGVRRARAVVHSRALASLFPDYSALITINKYSDLTDELVGDKLGLDASNISCAAPSINGSAHPVPVVVASGLNSGSQPVTQPTATDPQSRSLSPTAPDRSKDSSPSKYATTHDHSWQPSLRSDQALASPPSDGLHPRTSSGSRPLPSPPAPTSSDQLPPRTSSIRSGQANEPFSPTTESQILTPSSAPAVDSHSPPPTILGPPVDLASSSGRQSGDGRSQRSTSPPQPPIKSDEQEEAAQAATLATEGQNPVPSQALQRDLELAAGADPTSPTGPTHTADTNDSATVTPSGQPAPLPLADRMHVQTVSPLSDRLPSPTEATVIHPGKPLDPKGIASTDFFPGQRSRKASLTTRLGSLGAAFGRVGSPRSPSGSAPQEQVTGASPSGQSPVSTPQSQKSPGSPTMSRFINSNLIKNFGRRISGTGIPSPPASPRDASQQATDVPPPPPPKDTSSLGQSTGPSPARDQPTTLSSNFMGNQVLSTGRPGSAGLATGRGGGISPSPSAKLALAAASQKSVRSEMEIQERFRRDLELKTQEREKEKLAENGVSNIDDGDEDEGLPYDRPDPEVPTSLATQEITPHQGLTPSELNKADGVREELAAADLAESGAAGAGSAVVAQSMATGTEDRARADGVLDDVSPGTSPEDTQPRVLTGGPIIASGLPVSVIAAEEASIAEAEQRQRHEAAQQAQEPEERRIKEEQDEAERRQVEEERVRREEEERIRLEEEEKRAQAERESEERRLVEEKAAEERRLLAEKEAEEQRLKAEQEAEEKRLADEKLAKEGQRKAEIRADMMSGKRDGGVMLNGWITVQTTKSLTWRRRHFTLFGHEMQLFKSEGDSKPIQTIHLGDSAKVSHTYEESQVQGSFKVAGSDGEDYFLYTDSAEDRETVLEGLAVALGQ